LLEYVDVSKPNKLSTPTVDPIRSLRLSFRNQRLILSCLQSDACIGPRFARRQFLMGYTDAEALEPAMGPLTEHSGVSRAVDPPRSRDGHEQWLTLLDFASQLKMKSGVYKEMAPSL
jgi:hypothetical protein